MMTILAITISIESDNVKYDTPISFDKYVKLNIFNQTGNTKIIVFEDVKNLWRLISNKNVLK